MPRHNGVSSPRAGLCRATIAPGSDRGKEAPPQYAAHLSVTRRCNRLFPHRFRPLSKRSPALFLCSPVPQVMSSFRAAHFVFNAAQKRARCHVVILCCHFMFQTSGVVLEMIATRLSYSHLFGMRPTTRRHHEAVRPRATPAHAATGRREESPAARRRSIPGPSPRRVPPTPYRPADSTPTSHRCEMPSVLLPIVIDSGSCTTESPLAAGGMPLG